MNDSERWVRECLGKKRYSTEYFAKGVASKIKKSRKIDLYTYRCPNCQGVHLTKLKTYVNKYNVLRVCQ